MKLQKVVGKIKKSNLAIIIGVMLFFLSSLITLVGGIGLIGDYYDETLGEKGVWEESLALLSGGVDIKYFDEILGAPVFKNNRTTDTWEYIYVNHFFYTQAVTDQNGKVIFYSVTTRDENFNPEVSFGPWDEETNRQARVVLGKTTFSELGDAPMVIGNYIGMHNYFYTEGYWTGNPGGYRTYIFSLNDSGYTKFLSDETLFDETIPYIVSSSTMFTDSEPVTDIDLISFRKNTVINTYTITAPMVTIDEVGVIEPPNLLLGPNVNQVRVLDWN